jgi:putative FmdB family regulatory protein
MPIYEYECPNCKTRFEKLVRNGNGNSPVVCDKCGLVMEKLLSAPMIHFKGSGWYITDYQQKEKEKKESKKDKNNMTKTGTGSSSAESDVKTGTVSSSAESDVKTGVKGAA